jgi:probable HAF family extracellular repeat protein
MSRNCRQLWLTPRAQSASLALVVTLGASVACGGQPEFRPLGFLNETGFGPSIAEAVSSDGSTVVGLSNSDQGFQAFRWTRAVGMAGLGAFANDGFLSSQAFGVSADGSVVVGASVRPDSLNEDGSPFRWTAATGLVYHGNLGGDSTGGSADAVSADGSIMVGTSDAADGTYQAFRWTQAAGMVALPAVLNQRLGRASALTPDGTVIVGSVSIGSLTNPKPVRWSAGAAELLPMLNQNGIGGASGVSADGSVVVGQSAGRAVRWTGAGVESLGLLPGGNASSLYFGSACSADGSVVVGLGDFNATEGTGTAIVWDTVHGLRDLNQVLVQDFGLSLDGFHCYWARGISADGKTIVGYGFNLAGEQEAFLADLHSGGPCAGDLDGDRQVSLSDLAILLAHFGTASGATPADGDSDSDGDVDLADLAALLARFGQSC